MACSNFSCSGLKYSCTFNRYFLRIMTNTLKNWAGNYTYGVPAAQAVHSIEEIQALVKKHRRLKVLGTRHCFNDIADSTELLISLGPLNKIHAPDKDKLTVTIDAGVR
jgi:alditol oxidase